MLLPRRCFGGLLGLAALCLPLLLATAEEAPASPKVFVLRGAKLLTQTDAGDFIGNLVVRDGKIAAVGADVAAPEGAQVIDLTGFIVTPGLIDAKCSLWLTPDAARDQGRDGSLEILDALNPYGDDWQDVIRQGVTTVYVQPKGPLGGFGAVLKVAPAASVGDLVVKADAGFQAALTADGARPAAAAPAFQLPPGLQNIPGLQLPQQPAAPAAAGNSITRYAQFEALKRFVEGVKKYQDDKPTKKDPLKERQLALLTKGVTLRVEAHYDDELKNVLKLAEELKLKVAVEGASQPKAIAAEMKARRLPLILGPIVDLEPATALRKTRAADWPKNCLADDGRFAIGTGSDQPRASQWLRLHASALAAKGIASDRVLKALTADAADLLGVGDQLGRLAVGQRATLAVFAGDPLDPSMPARLVLVDGKIVHENADVKPRGAKSAVTSRLVSASFSPDNADEDCDAMSAELRPGDRLDPQAKPLRRLRAAGFGAVVLAPPGGNVVAGELMSCELMADGAVAGKPLGFSFVLSDAARKRERYPASLAGQIELLDAALSGKPAETRLYVPEFLRDRLLKARQAALRDLISKKQIAYFTAETGAEIDAALALIDKYGLKAVLVDPIEFRPRLEEIKRLDVALLVRAPTNADTTKTWMDVAVASQSGVPLLFGGSSPDLIRAAAAAATQAGADEEAVLAGLGAAAAKRLGFAPQVGVNLAWTGSPVDLRSEPRLAVTKKTAAR